MSPRTISFTRQKALFTKMGVWVAHMTLKEQKSETLQGQTKEEVQEQMLHFLGQQALEIEKAQILLGKSFESTSEK